MLIIEFLEDLSDCSGHFRCWDIHYPEKYEKKQNKWIDKESCTWSPHLPWADQAHYARGLGLGCFWVNLSLSSSFKVDGPLSWISFPVNELLYRNLTMLTMIWYPKLPSTIKKPARRKRRNHENATTLNLSHSAWSLSLRAWSLSFRAWSLPSGLIYPSQTISHFVLSSADNIWLGLNAWNSNPDVMTHDATEE